MRFDLSLVHVHLLLLRFNLDEYTNWWNSPQASIYFWSGFAIFVLVIVGALMLWVRKTRSVK